MIRLIALDIDGTLLDSHSNVPDANRRAVARVIERGIEVVLATGRRFEFARPIFEALPSPLTLILSNGAIVKTREGQTLMRRLLPRAIARDVLARTIEHRETAALIFDRPHQGQVVFEAVDWDHSRHRRFFQANRPFISEVRPLEDALTEDPVQIMFTGPCASMRALFDALVDANASAEFGSDAIAAVAESRNGHRYSVALTEYLHRDFSLVDVIRAGCSKGQALREWAEHRGVAPHEILAIGDNLNDVEMLEFAGRPVLMATAVDELKARGWHVTASNDAAGVSEAIETFVLREAS